VNAGDVVEDDDMGKEDSRDKAASSGLVPELEKGTDT
jgi:hypothetical protein